MVSSDDGIRTLTVPEPVTFSALLAVFGESFKRKSGTQIQTMCLGKKLPALLSNAGTLSYSVVHTVSVSVSSSKLIDNI